MGQISFFDGDERLRITKPLRLIELFGGIGSQAKSLENLGVEFEHYRLCEFDKYAIQSYNAIHGTNFETSDITQISADDLGVVDTDKYTYLMTYSFPCQDLSLAGKRRGIQHESVGDDVNTRSGLLFEVQRLLEEMTERPQILLMENVPQVLTDPNFPIWLRFLEDLGYTNKWEVLCATDYGVPQHRERAFMISFMGDYYYDFPEGKKLKTRLKHYLEDDVDEKFYLSQTAIEGLCRQLENT